MTLRVTEFVGQGGDLHGALAAPVEPNLGTSKSSTLTSTPQKVCVLKSRTRLVRIFAEVDAVFEIVPDALTNTTLDANGELLPAGQDTFRTLLDWPDPLAVWARTA